MGLSFLLRVVNTSLMAYNKILQSLCHVGSDCAILVKSYKRAVVVASNSSSSRSEGGDAVSKAKAETLM